MICWWLAARSGGQFFIAFGWGLILRDQYSADVRGAIPGVPLEWFDFPNLIALPMNQHVIQPSSIVGRKFWNRWFLIIDRAGETGTIIRLWNSGHSSGDSK
jgi:hypothetical protein